MCPNFTFTFTHAPFDPINMSKTRHRLMIGRRKRYTAIRYRKRPEPHQVVPLASLKMTENKIGRSNNDAIVSHSGDMEASNFWLPMNTPKNLVEVNPKGWSGLHRRMLMSRPAKAEVS